MRLTNQQTQSILSLVRESFGNQAKVRLFGSRVDDAATGGDIDLLIELAQRAPLAQEITLSAQLEQHLGTPIDLLTAFPGEKSRPIVELARMTGFEL